MDGIASLPGFRTLAATERKRLRDTTTEQAVAKGQFLFTQGQVADTVWAVKDGVIHLLRSGPDGREIVLEVIPPSELFGAVVALEERPYPASAMAGEAGAVWRTPARLVRELCLRHPTLRSTILEQATARLRAAHERLRSVALERVEQRLARALLTLAEKIGRQEEAGIVVTLTRQELADMVGSTVETAIRVVRRWQTEGIVAPARRGVRVCSPDALRRIADDP